MTMSGVALDLDSSLDITGVLATESYTIDGYNGDDIKEGVQIACAKALALHVANLQATLDDHLINGQIEFNTNAEYDSTLDETTITVDIRNIPTPIIRFDPTSISSGPFTGTTGTTGPLSGTTDDSLYGLHLSTTSWTKEE